jgi:hypothetical protein
MPEVTAMLCGILPSSRTGRNAFIAAALACGLGFGAAAASAQATGSQLGMTLGGSGELYSTQTGLYGALFGGGGIEGVQSVGASTPVLALQVTLPGAPPQLLLVPSSDDGSVESSPALVYEDQSDTLFVVWVSTTDQVASSIKLVSYSGGQWSQPITVISNPYATKTTPQLALTRDSHQEIYPVTGSAVTHHRTVLSIVWSEDSASGVYQAYYAPVIFEDGIWIGTVPSPILLNSFDLAEQTTQGGPFPTPLAYAPSVQGGRDASTIIAGFASEVSGLLTAVEVDALPEDLRLLGDNCSAAILANGQAYFPGQLSALANQVQAALVANGSSFQPEALQGIISDALAQVTAGAPDLPTLALKTRAVIIDTGAKIAAARGLLPIVPALGPVAPSQVIEIVPPIGPSQFIQVRVAASRSTPAVGNTTNAQMFLSRTGDNAIVSWLSTGGGSLYYLNTRPDGTWSSGYQLQLAPTFNLTQALQVIQGRVYF